MSPRATRRLLFTGAAAAPALALTVAAWATLGPWVTGLLALVVFCTAAAAYTITVAVIYGDVARMDAAAAKAAKAREVAERAAANRAFYDRRGITR